MRHHPGADGEPPQTRGKKERHPEGDTEDHEVGPQLVHLIGGPAAGRAARCTVSFGLGAALGCSAPQAPPRHRSPGYGGNFEHSAATCDLTSAATSAKPGWPIERTTRPMKRAMSAISGSFIPCVVTAGVPKRRPLPMYGFSGSNGTVLRLQVMPASSSASCAGLPFTPKGRTSARIRCVSVPPDTSRKPSSIKPDASALALATIW